MFNLKKLFLFSIALISFNLNSKVLVWDLGGVLFGTNTMLAASEIGLWDLFLYADKFNLKTRIFDVLNTLGKQTDPKYIAYNGDQILPEIMCKWMTGEMNGPELIDTTLNQIETLDKENFFTGNREKKIIQNSIRFMFDPEKLASAAKPNRSTLKVLKQCKKQTDNFGNPEHQLYVISNWDKLSFDALYNTQQGQSVFNCFNPNNILVSANVGMIKPHKNIFEYFLKTHNLKAEDCIFIDDQLENIKTAQDLGFTGIIHKGAKSLKKELRKLKVL